jgi:hypothetical protein
VACIAIRRQSGEYLGHFINFTLAWYAIEIKHPANANERVIDCAWFVFCREVYYHFKLPCLPGMAGR